MTSFRNRFHHTVDAAGVTRRTILRDAGAGFVLTASGLFVPVNADEAAAREGALGGKLGGRHGHNHRGRNTRKRRKHDGKKDKGKDNRPPGAGAPLYKWIGISGITELGAIPYGEVVDDLEADFYFRVKGLGDTYSALIFKRTVKVIDAGPDVKPEPGRRFQWTPDRYRAAIYLRSSRLSRPIFDGSRP